MSEERVSPKEEQRQKAARIQKLKEDWEKNIEPTLGKE
jgi:hypothetical protein